ncbi:hypothetical protein ACEPPN_018937 [Leptodophora sp. 'Broadleaf-Isolate-01']
MPRNTSPKRKANFINRVLALVNIERVKKQDKGRDTDLDGTGNSQTNRERRERTKANGDMLRSEDKARKDSMPRRHGTNQGQSSYTSSGRTMLDPKEDWKSSPSVLRSRA